MYISKHSEYIRRSHLEDLPGHVFELAASHKLTNKIFQSVSKKGSFGFRLES